MVALLKIDSNLTGLSYAEEETIGVLPVTPIWIPLEPNEYTDFGGQLTTIARNPINPSRQRKKGVVTDLDASGGFSSDFTLTNMQDLLQGFLFANARTKTEFGGDSEITGVTLGPNDFVAASGLDAFLVGDLVFANNFTDNNGLFTATVVTATNLTVAETTVAETPPATATLVKVGMEDPIGDDIDVVVSGTLPTLISNGTFDFTDLGLVEGEWIFVGGDTVGDQFVNPENNGYKRVRSITATTLTIDKTDSTMVAETTTSVNLQIFIPRTIKNELGDDIVRRTYNLERTLGKADTGDVTDQSEYLVGAVPSTFSLAIPTADKLVAEMAFVATDNEQRTASTGPKSGTRQALVESDAVNTSSDIARTKLALVVPGDAAPTPLFAFATEINLSIDNNVSPNKAVGILGAFEVTAGTFTVNGDMTVYLSEIAAVAAVRDNEDITFDTCIWKDNAGFIFDIPLIALGDGRANVEQDAPITLPLTLDAATAAKIDENLDYTLMFCFFDYLPDAGDIDL